VQANLLIIPRKIDFDAVSILSGSEGQEGLYLSCREKEGGGGVDDKFPNLD
jgi:hypothetical protein